MAEYGRPYADTHIGSYTDEDGNTSSLYASIDEHQPDPADYIQSPQGPSSEVYVCALGEIENATSSLIHRVRYRYGTDGGTLDLTVELREGYVSEAGKGTLIASWSHTGVTDSEVGASQTLTSGEISSITDYSDLFLRFVWTAQATETHHYPDADPESTSVDGHVAYRWFGGESWADIRTAAGNYHDDDGSYIDVQITCDTNVDEWDTFYRGIILFDTPSVGGTVQSATLTLTFSSSTSDFGGQVSLVSSNPASDTDLVDGDYDSLGTTLLSDDKPTIAGRATGDKVTFALNAAGMAAINFGGITKLGLRIEADRTDSEPTWASGAKDVISFFSAEAGAYGYDPPKLTVETVTRYGRIHWAAMEVRTDESAQPSVIALLDDLPCDGGSLLYRIPDMVRASVTRDRGNRHRLALVGPMDSSWTSELRRGRVIYTELPNGEVFEWIIGDVEDGVGAKKDPVTTVTADPVESVLTDCGPIRTVTTGGTTSYIVEWTEKTATQIIDDEVLPALQDYGITYVSRGTVDSTQVLTGSAELVTPGEVMAMLEGATNCHFRLRRNGTTGYYLDLVNDLSDGALTARVRSGVNLLELARTRSGEDIATAIVVRGADMEGFRSPIGLSSWEVSAITASGGNQIVTLIDPDGGPGPVAIDDQFVDNGLGASDPKAIGKHYLRYEDGTTHEILNTSTEGDVTVASVTGLSVGDRIHISPDSDGTLLTEAHSPTGLNLYGRVCRYVDMDGVSVRDNESSNPVMNSWTTKPFSVGAVLDGDQIISGSVDIKGAPPGKEIHDGDRLKWGDDYGATYLVVNGDVTIASDGTATVPLNHTFTSTFEDQRSLIVYSQTSLPDDWAKNNQPLIGYRPSDQSGTLTGSVGATYVMGSGATLQHAFLVDGLTAGDRIYLGDKITVEGSTYHAQNDAEADAAGECLLVVGSDAVGYPTVGATVTIERATPTFQSGQTNVINLLPQVVNSLTTPADQPPTILSPSSNVRLIEGNTKLWASAAFHLVNHSDSSITIQAGGTTTAPIVKLYDGSSNLASTTGEPFSLDADEEATVIVRAGAEISADGTYQVNITPPANFNEFRLVDLPYHEPTVALLWAELSLSVEEPEAVTVASNASSRVLHQTANRELLRSHTWPTSLEVSHRELVEKWGADPGEPKLTLGQTVRIIEPDMGIDTEMVVDRIRWKLHDPNNPRYTLGRAEQDYTERVVRALGGGGGGSASAVTSVTSTTGGGSTVDGYTDAEIEDLLLGGVGVDYEDAEGNEEPLATRTVVLVRDGIAQALPTLGDSVILKRKDGSREDLTLISQD